MMQTTCPSCGAEISFKAKSSVMGVCQYCHSLLLRADAKLEEIGKVADLLDLKTPLYSGITGSYQGVNFQITGRTQIRHELGGIWTEWYAYFADGRWGWITEAQGRFYVTFVRQVERLPDFNSLILGQPARNLSLPVKLVVAEKGIAEYLGAEGEIPFYFTPGERYYYADLSGQQNEFATIDYSEQQPLIFIGRLVTLADLGIHPETPVGSATMADLPAQQVAVEKLSCPHCGGPLELRAPDHSERIACPYCASLLDVNQGKLKFIKELTKPPREPLIPLGAVAEFDGEPMTVVGYMMRSTVVDKVEYFWEEFLLYNPKIGFGWLVRTDDHWIYVKSAQLGEITEGVEQATYKGKQYKLFNANRATVVCVMGEFYWKVEVGETTTASDYVRPGEMLSKEVFSTTSGTGEVNWSHGYYIYPDEIARKFQIEQIPKPTKPGLCEPFKYQYIFKYWGWFLLVLLLAGIFFAATSSNYLVYDRTWKLEPVANSTATQVFFSEEFRLRPRRNICIIATSPVDNSWVYFEGDLINEETGLVQAFSAPIEYYHGVSGGESWREGDQTTNVYLSALPEGKYTLRVEAQWEKWQQPTTLNIRIVQGHARFVHFAIAIGLVSILPIFMLFKKAAFENRKWQESAFGPSNSE